jgi:8-amino-7-oxononanoate synthase
MLEFTSSLYLGLKHGSASIEPWDELTTGAPAALTEPPGAAPVAQALASLMGCGRGLLLASTLHLFWDVFGGLGGSPARIYWDAGLYPIARWGVERAAGRGALVRRFAHHDAGHLRRLLAQDAPRRGRPAVVSDGFCPGCGREAPLREYLESVRGQGGVLVLDDTQALGIFGRPSAGTPYGSGGGGSLRRQGLEGPDILVGSSLAKAFGVPVAVLAGGRELIRVLEGLSETRVHCSPPSAAVIHASRSALATNARHGDALRYRLAERVARFHRSVERMGLPVRGGLFPTQSISSASLDVRTVHGRLRAAGIRAVLHRARCSSEAALTFVITAMHSPEELDRAAQGLAEAAATARESDRPSRRTEREAES